MKKNRYLSSHPKRDKKKQSNRTCRICGKDAFPNYFFCPSCHHRVTATMEFTESEVNTNLDFSRAG
ncbi:hypothetical protein C6A37_02055 [Desulfobacteraceae bacterium SEEP-SAG9]|nr:hypothetical protein C6A37_02055 [Desulfobacteraceae bacterium SEEP-SAG9]